MTINNLNPKIIWFLRIFGCIPDTLVPVVSLLYENPKIRDTIVSLFTYISTKRDTQPPVVSLLYENPEIQDTIMSLFS